MEGDQVQMQSDLLALRQLYGLLQNIIGFGIPNISLENVGKLLDKKALQLLKNLLDDARQRLSKTSTAISQDRVVYSEVSKLRFSSNKKNQCQSRDPCDQKKPEFRIGNCSNDLSSSSCSTSLMMDKKLLSEFSKEVTDAIFEIDSRVLALQNLMMNTPAKNYNNSLTSETIFKEEKSFNYDETLSRQASHQPSQYFDIYKPRNRLESVSRHGTSYVHGLRVPLSQDQDDSAGTSWPSFGINQNNNPTARKASSATRRITRSGDYHHKIITRPTLLMDQQANQSRSNIVLSSDPSSSSESETKSNNSIASPTRSSTSSSSVRSSSSDDEQTQSSSSYSRSHIRINPIFSRRERDNSEKGIGRLRRIKNKLGLIFHHHHHHHHHHRGNNRKLLQRIFHAKNNNNNIKAHIGGVKDRKGTRKSVVKSSTDRKNVRHFHALVEGLMQHVGGRRRRRRVKKAGTGKLGEPKKRLGKGIGWWQRFGGRGGVKMVNRRGRVRVIRFANKTPKLKM
ncbi:protein KOKOPELLI [Morus notabilis]|nr:protein KOKOPELLI [Morus notabilis]